MINETFDYVAYLDIKKAIDDRSLNADVWQSMLKWLGEKCDQHDSIQILEIGAGIGTMIERLLEQLTPVRVTYQAVEPEPAFMSAARNRLQRWAQNHGLVFSEIDSNDWVLTGNDSEYRINWICAEAGNLNTSVAPGTCDLLIAHAVVDLLPVPELLPRLMEKLNEHGAYYFSLNYAGKTTFDPEHPSDSVLMQAYNRDMDKRHQQGNWQASLTGKKLGTWLRDQGHRILAEGSSDWQLGGEDSDFIENILDTINKALSGDKALASWYEERCHQLRQHALRLEITNADYFGLK